MVDVGVIADARGDQTRVGVHSRETEEAGLAR